MPVIYIYTGSTLTIMDTSPGKNGAVKLSDELTNFLNMAAEKMGMSARGYNRIKRIARTIADLRGAGDIEMQDLAEAISYRPINRGKYGVKSN